MQSALERSPAPLGGALQPIRKPGDRDIADAAGDDPWCFRERLRRASSEEISMTQDELRAWALGNGWQVIGGYLSLTKPSAPKEAIVRMVLKASVVHVEVKRPAGKWEKLTGESYAKVVANEETGVPGGLGLETIPGFRMLMQENRDRQVFAKLGG